MALSKERRRRLRVKLVWTTRLARDNGGLPVECRTVDVSSTGFYCVCDEPFRPGEFLWCQILAPTRNPLSREECLCLECRVEVVRVNRLDGSGHYGLGCRIDDFCVCSRPFSFSSAAGKGDGAEVFEPVPQTSAAVGLRIR